MAHRCQELFFQGSYVDEFEDIINKKRLLANNGDVYSIKFFTFVLSNASRLFSPMPHRDASLRGMLLCVQTNCKTETMITPIIPEQDIKFVSDLITNHDKIVITCHVSPDGDALGSSLGLYHYLTAMGKQVAVVIPDMAPRNLHFLPGMRYVTVYMQSPEKAVSLIDDAELIFCLDFNALKRIDKLAPSVNNARAKKVLIDHHLGPENFCDLIISYPHISSTSELIFRLIYQMGEYGRMPVQSAETIYAGMMTDTGNFTYNSNDPEIYYIIAELVKKGINKDRIYTLACNTQSADKLKLNSYAICHKMEIFPEYKAAVIYLTQAEMEQYNFQKGDCEGLVNVPLSIRGIEFSAFIREDRNYIKISLRSQGKFAVNTIAENHFNGGGHRNASGGEFYGTLDEAVRLFKEILPIYCSNEKSDKAI